MSEIVRSIKDAIKTGEYKDTTGLAEREEVNAEEIRQHKTSIEDAKVTERDNHGREEFTDFYSNKKGDTSRSSTPSEEARAIDTDNALSGAKVQQNSETAKDSEEKIKEQRVYHGSGAEFDEFDHSHMGEGAGSQTFGYGTYVTNTQAPVPTTID